MTADDFGFSQDTLDATIACLAAGVVRNASIMVTAPATDAAMDYALAHPEHCYGIHLVLCRIGPETTASNVSRIPDLVDANGRLYMGRRAQLRAALGLMPVDQVASELTAQLSIAANHGVRIDYVDAHRHFHKYPTIAKALEQVLPRFGISRVRRVQNVYLARPYTSPTYWLSRPWGDRLGDRWRTTDGFYMSTGPRDLDFLDLLRGSRSYRTLEVGAHPGTLEDWRIRETAGLYAFASALRDAGLPTMAWSELS